ncbi:hypothetical protein [Planctomicrobium piriforme]|uniref:hypothetical protein n=1 Tax=Planctomicrobium piriforme TaxID=1576369 RepID=UPI00111396DA|nr:hypothetical protein [Planctomicrobium piriforme]
MQWLVLAVLLFSSCGYWGPRQSPGASPWIGPGKKATRFAKMEGDFFRGYAPVPYWDEGQGSVLAKRRIESFLPNFPRTLFEKLEETEPALTDDGTSTYDKMKFDAIPTVISLNPDIAVVTLRPMPRDTMDDMFPKWTRRASDRIEYETIGLLDGRWFFTGVIFPSSDEIYVISTAPEIPVGLLEFKDNRAVIPFNGGRLVLTRDGDVVSTVRE